MSFTRRNMLIASSATLTASVLARVATLCSRGRKTDRQKVQKSGEDRHGAGGSTLLDKCKLLKELGFDGVELDAPAASR